MFKFNFSKDNLQEKEYDETESNVHWFNSKEITAEELILVENLKINFFNCGDHTIKYVSSEEVVNILKCDKDNNDRVLNAEQNHSDLIQAVYEGGLKVWECTYDLLNFINTNNLEFSSKSVLDLGCGAGLIGIISCLKGADTCFQDYNNEVIKYVTGTNVKLNNIIFDKCKFYSGDWKSFLNLLKDVDKKFDYIFTSETIYNTENYRKLLDIFSQLIKPTGIIYLAAKYHYFGVGGGISHFEDMLAKDQIFNYSTEWLCPDGVKRAIMKITLKQS